MSLLRFVARSMLASYFVLNGVKAFRDPESQVAAAEPIVDKLMPLATSALPRQVSVYLPEDATGFVKCTGAVKDAAGNLVEVHCTYDPDTRSGTPGADARKVKGNIHWLSAAHAVPAEVRLYDRLFGVPFPGARNPWGHARGGEAAAAEPAPEQHHVVAGDEDEAAEIAERNYLDDLNPGSKRVIRAYVEPALAAAQREERVQFERHGYFVADLRDHAPAAPVFNRAVSLKDSWSKG